MSVMKKLTSAALSGGALFLSASALAISLFGSSAPSVDPRTDTPLIEVESVFWYGCPHCVEIDAALSDWAEDKFEVELFKVPAPLSESWVIHARLYYAAEKLGILSDIHQVAFELLLETPEMIGSGEDAAEFLAEYGVTLPEARAAFFSDEVTKKVMIDFERIKTLGIKGAPAVIVDGKHVVTMAHASDAEGFVDVVDLLVEQILNPVEGK